MAGYRIISSDNHVFEPADLWATGIEPAFKDRAPHVVRKDDGDWWLCEGKVLSSVAGASQTGRRFDEPEKLTGADFYENVRPGGYIPQEAVKDMDADGVDVSIVYPTVGLILFSTVSDSWLLDAIFRRYNDWLAEFCSPFPDRLKGICMINVDDVQVGIKELERCAKLGLAGAMITVYPPHDAPYDLPVYEPLWSAADDLGTPLSLHFATNRRAPGQDFTPSGDSLKADYLCNVDYWIRRSLAQIIFSGVFERHPKLQVGSVEQELSWIPHFLERMDYTYTQRIQREGYHRYKEDMLPSDYFHRNVFAGFQEDALGVGMRDLIGVDNIQWGSDYPHVESTFPRSRQILEELLADCTEEQKSKIAGGNAARIYNL